MKIRKIDHDGLILCDIQAETFELSIDKTNTSSEIFIRRFMHSEVAKYFDNKFILDSTLSSINILELLENEYGPSNYGNIKYTKEEIYWIGYIYRYFSYTYNYSSTQVYKIVKPKE